MSTLCRRTQKLGKARYTLLKETKDEFNASRNEKMYSVFRILFIYSLVLFRIGPSILSGRQGRSTSTACHWLEGRLLSFSV